MGFLGTYVTYVPKKPKEFGPGLGFQFFEDLDLCLLQIELYNIKKYFFLFLVMDLSISFKFFFSFLKFIPKSIPQKKIVFYIDQFDL